MKPIVPVDTRKASLYFTDGTVTGFSDQRLAYAVWLALPKGVRAAFRGTNDTRSVDSWDYADAPVIRSE